MLPGLRLLAPALVLVPGMSRAAEQTGLPQFDPHSFASQLFWLAVMFVVVYLFMQNVAIPRLSAIMDERRKRIVGDLDEAERARKQADETLKGYEATLAEAHGRARKLLAETHERNVAALSEQTRAASAAFDQRVLDAVKRIDTARAAAMQGIRAVALDLAADIATKVAGHTPAADKVARAVDAAAGPEAA